MKPENFARVSFFVSEQFWTIPKKENFVSMFRNRQKLNVNALTIRAYICTLYLNLFNTYTSSKVHTHTYTRTHTYTHQHTNTQVPVQIHIHVQVHIPKHTLTHVCKYTYTPTNTYTHINTVCRLRTLSYVARQFFLTVSFLTDPVVVYSPVGVCAILLWLHTSTDRPKLVYTSP